jgi:hypothetical protein
MVSPEVEHELSARTTQLLGAPLPEEPKARRTELERRSAVQTRMIELATQATTAGEFLLALADESLLPPGDEVYEDIQPLPPLPGENEQTREEHLRFLQEASKFWDRPDVKRMLERMAQGLPPVDEDDEW